MAYKQLKLDNQICFRLYTVSRLVIQAYRPYLEKLGITYSQYLTLMVLWEHGDMPVNDIAKKLMLETNTITPLLKRMETLGIVKRVKGKEDARQMIVTLTEKGRDMEQEAKKIPHCMGKLLKEKCIEEETVRKLIPALDDMIRKLSGQKFNNK